jgi:quercetin dioxygenase-like cupin family protein
MRAKVMAAPVIITEILKTGKGWNGSFLPGYGSGKTELRVLIFKMAPGAKTTIHMHPLNGAGYIIKGELTMVATKDPHGNFKNRKQIKKTKLIAGEAWAETVYMWHYGINTGKTDLEFVLIFAGQEGTPPTLSLGTQIR